MLGRTINDLGAKTRVMELMSHPDSDVKYRALVTVQRCLFFLSTATRVSDNLLFRLLTNSWVTGK